MAATKGADGILQVDTTGSGSWSTIGGVTTNSVSFNNQPVDITTKDSNEWRDLLESGGIRSASISVAGVFLDAAVDETFRGYSFADTIDPYRIVFANGDTLSGSFMVSNYQRQQDNADADRYTATLESSGAITYTAA